MLVSVSVQEKLFGIIVVPTRQCYGMLGGRKYQGKATRSIQAF
jgi:hypothetical protein